MNKIYCDKVVFKNNNGGNDHIILGIIETEDDNFITVRTRNKTYRLNKKIVMEMTKTKEEFDTNVLLKSIEISSGTSKAIKNIPRTSESYTKGILALRKLKKY